MDCPTSFRHWPQACDGCCPALRKTTSPSVDVEIDCGCTTATPEPSQGRKDTQKRVRRLDRPDTASSAPRHGQRLGQEAHGGEARFLQKPSPRSSLPLEATLDLLLLTWHGELQSQYSFLHRVGGPSGASGATSALASLTELWSLIYQAFLPPFLILPSYLFLPAPAGNPSHKPLENK